jgi:hypothetical protein
MRLPQRGLVSRLSKTAQILFGLLNKDVRAAERLVAHMLWSMPKNRIEEHLLVAPRLPDGALGAGIYADREAMLGALPKGGIVAEVGTWQGYFSRQIIEVCRPHELHLIDLDFSQLGDVEGHRHQGDSSTILSGFPAGKFDWIYIDGDHSLEGVERDLHAADYALKRGGFLVCNDYTNWCSPSVAPYGVARAVNEFVIAKGYLVEGIALHKAGLYDLLIRKP